jgi:hypothetical protein
MYSESQLRIPVLQAVAASKSGFMSTSDIIAEMTQLFEPDGHDLEILLNRSDTHFSQKVRNVVSHRSSSASLIKKGYATYHKNLAGLKITEAGREYLKSKGL